MAEIIGKSNDITLQINTNGAWKHLCRFPPAKREAVLRATAILADVLGPSTTWALLHADGRREWLPDLQAWYTPTGFDAHDMASAAAQGFRDGAASKVTEIEA